jgi:hypothetical protein
MRKDAKIFVAGHRGLVGSALVRCLERSGFTNILKRSRSELDLCDSLAVRTFFDAERPDYVMLAAAKVGGILANETYPAEFIHSNLVVQTNVIHECWRHEVKRLLFLGSSCVYPRACPQPIKEEYLLSSELEPTNRAYALAKIAGIEMCASYNRQYGTKYLAAMPTNLYGPGDNYDLASSHVLPALIRKCHEAKVNGATGSRSGKRQPAPGVPPQRRHGRGLRLPHGPAGGGFARIAAGSPVSLINIGRERTSRSRNSRAWSRKSSGSRDGSPGIERSRTACRKIALQRPAARAGLAPEHRLAPGNPADLRGISFLAYRARLEPRQYSPAHRHPLANAVAASVPQLHRLALAGVHAHGDFVGRVAQALGHFLRADAAHVGLLGAARAEGHQHHGAEDELAGRLAADGVAIGLDDDFADRADLAADAAIARARLLAVERRVARIEHQGLRPSGRGRDEQHSAGNAGAQAGKPGRRRERAHAAYSGMAWM